MCNFPARRLSEEMSFTLLCEVLIEARGLGASAVTLTGGEPLMYQHLFPLTDLARDIGYKVVLMTNGTLLSENMDMIADRFSAICVPFEADTEEVYDRVRSPGAFSRMRAGIASVKEHFPETSLVGKMTLTKSNFRFVRETVQAAYAAGLDVLWVLPVAESEYAFGGNVGAGQMLSEEEINEFRSIARRLAVENFPLFRDRVLLPSPQQILRYGDYFYRRLKGAEGQLRPCGEPEHSIIIDADGSVKPCYFQKPVGSLVHNSIGDILSGRLVSAKLREFRPGEDPVCADCVGGLA